MERGTRRWVVGLLAALTILAAACSGNNGDDVDADAQVRTPAMPAIEGPTATSSATSTK